MVLLPDIIPRQGAQAVESRPVGAEFAVYKYFGSTGTAR